MPPQPPLYVIRHGQTDWNAEFRLQGQADVPINALGRDQAFGNGRRLARLIGQAEAFRFIASPMGRTRETMEIVRGAMGLDPDDYVTDARLVEVHFGDWQGRTFAEIDRDTPGAIAERDRDKWNFVPPGAAAESYAMLMARVLPVFEELHGPTVVVAHGGIIRSLFRRNGLSEYKAATLTIPQDRLLRVSGDRLEWL
ncbi:MAG: histidine phosphatase family protein [Rhizobiaceae bacterium]